MIKPLEDFKSDDFYDNTSRSTRNFNRISREIVYNDCDKENEILNVMNATRKHLFTNEDAKQMYVLALNLNAKNIVANRNRKGYIKKLFKNLKTTFCQEKDKYFVSPAFEYIHYLMRENTIIYLTINLHDYIFCDEENDHTIHSCACILHPETTRRDDNIKYNMFFINSHGNDTTKFVSVINKTNRKTGPKSNKIKLKNIHISSPIEIYIMRQFKNEFNKYIKEVDLEYEIKPCKLNFSGTKKDVYFGANLQIGDIEGLCYVYPQLIYYYFGRYYDTPRRYDYERKGREYTIEIPSMKEMLLQNRMIEFIYSIFIDLNVDFKNEVIGYFNTKTINTKKHIKKIDEFLENKEFSFIYNISIPLFNYTNQNKMIEFV